MNKELSKVYEPNKYEDRIYEEWGKSGYFSPDKCVKDGIAKKNAKSFTIALPPPNRTGTLHIGHALMLVVQDILIRYHRMKGYKTLWIPGTDHAAIATQSVVEKKLYAEEKKTRHDLGREKFLKQVYDFADKSHKRITEQVKKMGSSLDWSREAYTLDEARTRTVQTVFKMMYDDGLIYRGDRVVNWCPRCHSTLADDEVEYKTQKAKLYTFKYSKNFPFAIATTRPETKLGDTAVAVNPKDERYKKYIGKTYEIDFVGVALKLKIIADRAVDAKFGTGAVGVTPAHSMVDWQMAQEHKLNVVKVINEDGKICKDLSDYSAKTVEQAREMIVQKLKEQGLLDKEEEMENNLSLCYRCHTPIEPLPSLQWFINVNKKIPKYNKTIKELSIEAVKKGVFGNEKIRIIPERFEKNYFHWMENLRDWCISRQIWFGHRIPVWYKTQKNKNTKKQNHKNEEIYIGVKPPEEKANFVFLHGFKRTHKVIDPFRWLNQQLFTEDNFCENLPNPDKPNRQEQAEFVLKNAQINENTVIVTHSLGGILALKIIEENNLKIKKLVMIAPGYNTRTEELRDYKGDDFDFNKINKLIEEVVIFQDLNDQVVRQEDNKIYVKKMMNAKLIAMEAPVSHFNCEECIEIYDELKKSVWTQDEDTLDTWFSSGLWTFSTLANSPDQIKIKDGKLIIDSDDFKNFHPTSVMETGYDILFFWVARMIIMTTYAVGDIPFRDVYLHGLVRDEKGRKMSKSLGNAIDPLDVCAKYGTDAVRLSLIIGTTPGNDINLSEEKIAGYRNFTNKLWNISRYILQNKKDTECPIGHSVSGMTLADEWILQKMQNLIKQVSDDLDNYRFSQAGEKLREFTWNDFADWYIEVSKFEKNSEKDKILMIVLQDLLKLWHPFMPFVTEAIWQEMGNKNLLMIEKWPRCRDTKFCVSTNANDFELIKNIIIAIRNARSQYRIKPSQKIKAVIYVGKNKELIESQAELIKKLRTGIDALEIKKSGEKIKDAIYLTVNGIEIYLVVPGFNFKAEIARIERAAKEQEARIKILEKKLSNKQFIKKAPEKIVNQETEKLELWQEELKKLKEQLKNLK